MISFKNKKILITGASGGIGNELVKKFVQLGGNVLGTGTNTEKLDSIKKKYPTIIHDGKVIRESAVIDEYLDEVLPGLSLRSKSPYERAQMRIWVKQLDEGVHAASATISACIAFRYQFIEGKTPEQLKETLDGYVDPGKRARMTENVMKGVSSLAIVWKISI